MGPAPCFGPAMVVNDFRRALLRTGRVTSRRQGRRAECARRPLAVDTSTIAARYRPRARREGTALCLSGGGFRAALFHAGALRRLNELGVLSQVRTVSSV